MAPEASSLHIEASRPANPNPTSSFVETAVGLGNRIVEHQKRLPTGDIGWTVLRMPGLGQAPQASQIGAHLYDGRAGIGLFFAALERERPDEGWSKQSLEAIQPTRRVLRKILGSHELRAGLDLGVGGMYGVGGLIYSFARTANFLGDAALLDDARSLCALLTEDRLSDRICDDLVTGTAGVVSALLVLNSLAPDPLPDGATPLELATRIAERLLSNRVSIDGRSRAWISAKKFPPLAGFSHGAAGIACSLIRLYRATRDHRYLDAAVEGLEYERTTFSEADQNWLDLRVEEPNTRCLNNWCHGAPGILLGRLTTIDELADEAIQTELAVAAVTTERQALTVADHVCCGNMGRAEILYDAGQTLDRHDLRESAVRLADTVRIRASENGTFGWQFPEGFEPSFFSGAAGIGYAYLRMTKPSLPSVLALA